MKTTWTFERAVKHLELPVDFTLATEAHFDAVLNKVTELMVAARKAEDNEEAIRLSQIKEFFKGRWNRDKAARCHCGRPKSRTAVECKMCDMTSRTHSKKLMPDNRGLHEVVNDTLIPTIFLSELSAAISKLKEVGDSFTTNRSVGAVRQAARKAGIKVISRSDTPMETDPQKKRLRIWRSDGKSVQEINAVISARLQSSTE